MNDEQVKELKAIMEDYIDTLNDLSCCGDVSIEEVDAKTLKAREFIKALNDEHTVYVLHEIYVGPIGIYANEDLANKALKKERDSHCVEDRHSYYVEKDKLNGSV